MRILRRHILIALLPLVFGLAASWGFAFTQDKCGRLVGPVFAPKCHWIQLEYQLLFLMGGTLLGCLVAAFLGAWLELRSRRAVQRADLNPGAPS
jgi:hypothetical protein